MNDSTLFNELEQKIVGLVNALKAEKEKFEAEPFHICEQCGATDKSHPDRDFRYRKESCICEACLSAENTSPEPESTS